MSTRFFIIWVSGMDEAEGCAATSYNRTEIPLRIGHESTHSLYKIEVAIEAADPIQIVHQDDCRVDGIAGSHGAVLIQQVTAKPPA